MDLTDVIIEAMPFSDALVEWCKKHPEFKEGLKFSNADGFIPLGQVITTHTKNVPDDEVIGFYTYDFNRETFKQDFIINVGGQSREFMLYTKLPNKKYSKYVQHINGFFAKYGKNGDYADTHHVGIDAIDGLSKRELSERARRAMRTGALIKQNGRRIPSQAEIEDVMTKIKAAKLTGPAAEFNKLPHIAANVRP